MNMNIECIHYTLSVQSHRLKFLFEEQIKSTHAKKEENDNNFTGRLLTAIKFL